MAETKKKVRQYSVEYLALGFIESPSNASKPMCLQCLSELSNDSMKPSKLRHHLETKHADKKSKSLVYFQRLRDNFLGRNTLDDSFRKQESKSDCSLLASYEISKIIARAGKPHTIGEDVILPAIDVVLSTMLKMNASGIIKNLPLSNNTVSRRIDEMAEDVENKLIVRLRKEQFSIQLDESTLMGNEALLLAYVRFLDDEQLREEMLFARFLTLDTKGETIFKEVRSFFQEKDIPFENIIACATDGAPAMVGRYRGFTAFLKRELPNVISIHCIIHRQHLVAKKLSGRLLEALNLVIKVVNHIKSNALQDRLFRQLCQENGEGFDRLVLHTEVRWLSKGNCLRRFIDLWDSISSFMEGKELGMPLNDAKIDIIYLSDLFEKLNILNKQLQGDNSDLLSSKKAIEAFIGKLKLYSANISRREFGQFSGLASVSSDINDDDCIVYVEHLKKINEDMQIRFKDILDLTIPNWVQIPFEVNATDVDIALQEEIVELQNEGRARSLFQKRNYEAWKNKEFAEKYPLLWKNVKFYLIAFPSSYLAETAFSKVNQLLTKTRNNLNITKRGDLRMALTKIEPDIKALASKHQAQGSH